MQKQEFIRGSRDRDALKMLDIVVDDSHLDQVTLWRDLFEGEGPDNYERRVMVSRDAKTGSVSGTAIAKGNTVDVRLRKKLSFNAHIQACKKWAGLFFNEKTDLKISDVDAEEESESTATSELEFLQQHYEDAGVWPMLEENFPEVFGMGTMAVVTEFSSDFGIAHKWHSAENIYPIEVFQGKIRSVVFSSKFEWTDGETYTLYNVHEEQRTKKTEAKGEGGVVAVPSSDNGYRIRNIIVGPDGGRPLTAEAFGLVSEYTSPVRLFAVFKPFNRKIRDFNNAFGIPIYFDSIDMIAEIDELYDIKHDETNKSRRNIFIDNDALTYDELGKANIPQHLFGTIVNTKALDGKGGEQKYEPIKEFAPDPRMEKYSTELQAAVNRFSDSVGLGSDAFKIDRGQKATATQVISENQEKYVNLKKHLSVNTPEFLTFNRAILSVAVESLRRTDLDPSQAIGFFIQDSVIVDDETKRQGMLEEKSLGCRSLDSYLIEGRNLSGIALEEEKRRIREDSEMDDLTAKMIRGGNAGNHIEKEGDTAA